MELAHEHDTLMADLLNDFERAAEKEKHLRCYSSLIRRARPYTLDDDAVGLIMPA